MGRTSEGVPLMRVPLYFEVSTFLKFFGLSSTKNPTAEGAFYSSHEGVTRPNHRSMGKMHNSFNGSRVKYTY